jgi:enoyl-CoA hydratase/carnithine racemase
VFDAAEALERGLVRSLHAPDALLSVAREIARSYVESSAPVSVALTRQLMWRGLTLSHPMDTHRADSRALRARGASADAQEGIGAFLEKREPNYPDRVSADLPDVWPEWVQPVYR